MSNWFKMQVYLSALLSMVPFCKPADRSLKVFVWVPKLVAGALSPLLGVMAGLGVALGFVRRDGKLAAAGLLGAGLVARYLRDIPAAEGQFEAAFGPGWAERLPKALRARGRLLPAQVPGGARVQRNLVYGQDPGGGKALLADLWLPRPGTPHSGLGAIYVHGSGWRVGAKDLGTRPFFRRLTGQGHVVLDIDYTLWPEADVATMVREVKQAILWLRANAPACGVNPGRIVLMGGSAGAHLALLAAYTPNHPAFQPAPDAGNTPVCGVVAFYPPVDFLDLTAHREAPVPSAPGALGWAAEALLGRLFMLHAPDVVAAYGAEVDLDRSLPALLGGSPDEIPETYRLLSPLYHVGDHCPPTLLLHGSDDVFGLTPGVRRLYAALQEAGVPSLLVEFPHSDHAFDLVLPQISPVAQAAICDVERFLALLSRPPVGEGS
jgi:acetyl esterase/lipase